MAFSNLTAHLTNYTMNKENNRAIRRRKTNASQIEIIFANSIERGPDQKFNQTDADGGKGAKRSVSATWKKLTKRGHDISD